MANALYAKAKQAFLSKQIDLLNDTIKATLVDSADYTLDIANHDFIDDVPAGARVATVTLSGKSVTGGVFDAADATFSSVTGDQCEYIIIWQDTGTESTSRLIAIIDTATGLPITPNGADINIVWDNGANKIFAL
ncbi:MAG: hypothetical protein AAC990_04815 [Dehalococcoides mccartyi]|uniref:hypothetical protein n=1 Tax=Dehalococcoides mccartyi TaxID=61435 RepID=UPI0030FBC236